MPLILDSDFETICIELTSVSCMIYIYIERYVICYMYMPYLGIFATVQIKMLYI